MKDVIDNHEFAKTNEHFRKACALVVIGISTSGEDITLLPTKRQASKFRRGMGSAFKAMKLINKNIK